MTSPAQALVEIRDFLKDLRLPIDEVDFASDSARRLYRRFHALLVWEIPLDKDDVDPSVRLYVREALADLATAYFLNLAGAHKASRLCVRGGIENVFRVVTAASGRDILAINTVYELVSACKDAWATTTSRLQRLNELYALYGELCKTVHSTAVGYMSLRIPFESILVADEEEFARNAAVLDTTFKLVGEVLFQTFHSRLNDIDFKNADYVRDSIEAGLKREITEAAES